MTTPAGRVKVDRSAVRRAFASIETSPDVTDSDLDTALASIDQDAVFAQKRAELTTVVWDRKSPINGVEAQYFLDREDVNEAGTDDIYLIMRGDQVVAFQPHDPEKPGFVRMPKGQGLSRGKLHADRIAQMDTTSEVINRIYASVVEKTSSNPPTA